MSTQTFTSTAIQRPIDHFIQMGKDAMRQSKAPRTRAAYACDWRQFTRWCAEHQQVPLPASVPTVVAYLSYQASIGRKTTTMGRHLISISLAHKSAGFDSPTATVPVREAMKGFRRLLGTKRTKKTAIRRDDLKRIFAAMDDPAHPLSIRDRALLLLGFSGAFRRSELVAIRVEDLEFVPDGVTVTIPKSKTDQEGQGRKVAIHRGSALCPMKALQNWLKTAEIKTGYVFRVVHWRGVVGKAVISGPMVGRIVQKYASSIGKDGKQYGGHSLRRGFCTGAAKAGATEVQIMAVTGHRSSAMAREYVEESQLYELNTSAMLGL